MILKIIRNYDKVVLGKMMMHEISQNTGVWRKWSGIDNTDQRGHLGDPPPRPGGVLA